MTTGDLASIPDLQDRHRKVLAERLGITTSGELAAADPKDVSAAMRRLRPRPTLAAIARWQDSARESAERADGSEWERAATFVVSFEQRERDGSWERQLVAEQTELEPEQPPEVWPGWDCHEICSWMSGRIVPVEPVRAPARKAASARPGRPRQHADPAPIRIDVVGLTSESGEVDLAPKRRTAVPEALEVSEAGRAVVAVGGVEPDQVVHLVVRVRRPGRPGRNLHKPVVHRGRGRVELPLTRLDVGAHPAKVLAWAPDRSVAAASVRLPTLVRRA
ncbi:MAG TPA: hypothetical protein VJU80_15090 [Solirubrobacteraceae bacterium]|nr:hypothetical protein [Solirubrobacteraceae bacterium]